MNAPILKNKPLEKSNTLAELRVSNGQPRYYEEKGKLLGLHLAETGLTNSELTQLLKNNSSDLELLHIARNGLSELTLQLPALKFLDARENKELTHVDLSDCPKLEKVVLNRCAISSLLLPQALPNLIQLEVSNNLLTALNLRGSIPKLRFLDISENKLSQLPTVLADCRDDFYLLAVGNQFNEITSGLLLDESLSDEERISRIKRYLSKFRKPIDYFFSETIKIILLGNTQVGKTTLANLLTGNRTVIKGSTHGVNFFETKIDDISVIGIDFGGQDYYHSIHFPLFSDQALYLLLWGNGQDDTFGTIKNTQTNEEEDIYPLNYWLGAVEYYMRDYRKIQREDKDWKDSQLNLYLINNQKIENDIPEKIRDLNSKDLKERHKIDAFIYTCLHKRNTSKNEEAKQTIFDLIRKHALRQPQPAYYTDLQKSINETRSNGKVVLSLFEFQQLHTQFTLEDLREDLPLLSYSVACHYLDASKLDEGTPFREALTTHFIVDLSQFTGWLYEILTIKELREKKEGYYQRKDAERWLKSEAAIKHLDFILGFMLHHKIIFEVKGEDGLYVVPQYLKPVKAGSVDALFLESFDAPLVKYEFGSYFHSNILAELIKRCYEYLLQEEVGWKYIMWKNKVVLYDEAEKEKRFLFLDFRLPEGENQAKPTISLSRYSKKPVDDVFVQRIMEKIEAPIKYYDYTKWVKSPFGTYLPFELLSQEKLLYSENQKASNLVFYQKYVYRRGDFKLFLPNEKFQMKKVFISYSHSDEGYKDELKRHFVSLINENLVSAFDDRELSMGGNWDLELKQKIDECDIMIALISVDFLNTGYIMNTEIPRAIEMGKTVVPIVVRPCDWTNTILGTYNGTLKGKVISLFEEQNHYYMPTFRSSSREERDMFWLQVVKEFRNKVFM